MTGAEERIRTAFARHGVRGTLHALDLETGASIGVDAGTPVVLASVFKLPLVVALFREPGLDLTERIELAERTAGPTGTAAMLDTPAVSLRDLAYLALAVSDNAAADALLDLVGFEAVRRTLADLGLDGIAVRHAARDFSATLVEDTGAAAPGEIQARLEAEPALLGRVRVRDPAVTNAGTAAQLTALLAMVWRDQAASAEACAAIRRLLRLQVWPHRLASGFPDAVVAGKTGTLPGIRNEVGVVETGDRAVAVAVFTQADVATAGMPHIDALIGATARIAVDALR